MFPAPLPDFGLQGGETQASLILRRLTAQRDRNEKLKAWKELEGMVRETADEFEAPVTQLVWMIAEVSAIEPDLDLVSGPPPLPWKINFEVLRLMRDNNKYVGFDDPPNHVPRLARIDEQLAAIMTNMVADTSQPLNPRFVATMMALTGMAQNVDKSKSLYTLTEAVIKSNDSEARQIVEKELLEHTLPSLQSTNLLRLAAVNMAAGLKIDNLKFQLLNGLGNPQALTEATEAANKSLQDPAGPDPREILNVLIDQAQKHPETSPILANQVHFDAMPDKRFDKALVVIIEAAPSSPLAGGWLDHQLLGAVEPRTVSKTLEALNAAGTTGNPFGAAVDLGLNSIFGPPKNESQADHANLQGPIPIDSTSHAIFQALVASDVQVHCAIKAWRALSRFVFVTAPAPPPAQAIGAAAAITNAADQLSSLIAPSDVYKSLLDAALAQPNTPPQVVDFLVRQNDYSRVADCLAALVMKASDQVSAQATRALLHSHSLLPVDRAILNLSYGDRVAFAQRIYENTATGGQPSPLLTGLLKQRSDTSPLPPWFGKSISDGEVPSPGSWVKAMGGTDKMLDLVLSKDSDVAMGAISALVWSAGGNDRVVPELADRVNKLTDQSSKGLMAFWLQERKKIYLNWLHRSSKMSALPFGVARQPGSARRPGASPSRRSQRRYFPGRISTHCG